MGTGTGWSLVTLAQPVPVMRAAGTVTDECHTCDIPITLPSNHYDNHNDDNGCHSWRPLLSTVSNLFKNVYIYRLTKVLNVTGHRRRGKRGHVTTPFLSPSNPSTTCYELHSKIPATTQCGNRCHVATVAMWQPHHSIFRAPLTPPPLYDTLRLLPFLLPPSKRFQLLRCLPYHQLEHHSSPPSNPCKRPWGDCSM